MMVTKKSRTFPISSSATPPMPQYPSSSKEASPKAQRSCEDVVNYKDVSLERVSRLRRFHHRRSCGRCVCVSTTA
jgi:hypothetical protein